jgi:hypothetical protein
MKTKSKNSDESNDPLAEELNFDELEIVTYGPGWKKVSARRGGPKLSKQAGPKLTRKPPSTKPRGRRAA